ncbi:hypothetical protein P7C73_g3142, partial [Tremellales sp. Uapishka_1]
MAAVSISRRVLLVGASGRFGSRLIPALLAHGHTVTAYVRNPSTLRTAVPLELLEQIQVVHGDAEDVESVKAAIRKHNCDSLICTAGFPAAPLFGKPTRLPFITRATSQAAVDIGLERCEPMRGWWLAGIVFMQIPGYNGASFYDHWKWLAPEHAKSVASVKSIPTSSLEWSIFCPSGMHPEAPQAAAATSARDNPLVLSKSLSPEYKPTWLTMIPLIGMWIETVRMARQHFTLLEDCADRLAAELTTDDGEWVGQLVAPKIVRRERKAE